MLTREHSLLGICSVFPIVLSYYKVYFRRCNYGTSIANLLFYLANDTGISFPYRYYFKYEFGQLGINIQITQRPDEL